MKINQIKDSDTMFIAIIGDLIDSKQLDNRQQIQEQLRSALDFINIQFKDDIVSQLTLTLGDEFQGLLKVGAPVCFILDTLESQISELNVRYGIGIGDIVTEINPSLSIGADGPAFWYAREALEYIHDNHDYGMSHTYLISEKKEFRLINDILALSDHIKYSMTNIQKETLHFIIKEGIYSDTFDQKSVAHKMNISDVSLYKRLKAGQIKVYLRSRLHIDQYLKEILL